MSIIAITSISLSEEWSWPKRRARESFQGLGERRCMVTAQAQSNPTNVGDLLNAKNPTGEQMIQLFECRSEVPRVFKAQADVFQEVLSKVTVSRSEMQTMAAWAARDLSRCAENGMPFPRDEFGKILTLCEQQLNKMEPDSGALSLQELSGWQF